jgi:hypothetical protein
MSGITPEAQAAAAEATEVAEVAHSLVIDSQDMYELGAEHLRSIKSVASKIDETRKSMTRPLDQAKAAIMDFFRPFADRAAAAEADLKRRMLGYQQQVEAERRAEAERLRREEEARRQAEREAAEAEAMAMAEQGKVDEAEATLAAAEMTAALPVNVTPTVEAPKASGISTRDNWKAEVTDFGALIGHVATHPQLQHLLLPALPELKKLAAALKEGANIPGVRVYNEPTLAARKS